ncbi:MAG: MaoC family dehydratase [Robiginitalea sp.]|uniref:MaoC family dehydratase n=1 Tax=Robiginitalea sp. TaxID=1902411 RepID=UPI003C73CEC5
MAKLVLENLAALRAFEGKDLPSGEWVTVTQEMIDDFAKATGDHQWIHTDVEKAQKLSPFKTTIAHGFLSVSLLSKTLGDLLEVQSAKMGVNYGLNKVRFPSPVPSGSRVRLQSRIATIESYGENGVKITWDCSLELENSPKPACVAQFISLMFE